MADYDLQYQDTYIDALLATANELKTAGYIYKGVATPSTNPGTPTERVAYLASEPGTYTNFGGIVITSGLYSLTYVSGTWTGIQMSAGSDIEVVQTTGDSTTDVMSQKAVTDSLVGSVIAYDNSQSGLASDNVQGALDESSSYIEQTEIDIASISQVNFGLWGNKWHSTTNNIVTKKVDVAEGEKYYIVADSLATQVFFMSTYNPVNNASVTYQVDGVAAGESAYVTVPNEMNYMVFQDDHLRTSGTPSTIFPSNVTKVDVKNVKDVVVNNSTNISLLENVIGEMIDTTSFPSVQAFMTPANGGTWYTASSTNKGKFIPVIAGERYRIKAAEQYSYFAFLKSNSYGGNNTPVTNFASNESCHLVRSGYVTDTIAPSDAQFLFISVLNGTTDCTPTIQLFRNYNKEVKSEASKLVSINACRNAHVISESRYIYTFSIGSLVLKDNEFILNYNASETSTDVDTIAGMESAIHCLDKVSILDYTTINGLQPFYTIEKTDTSIIQGFVGWDARVLVNNNICVLGVCRQTNKNPFYVYAILEGNEESFVYKECKLKYTPTGGSQTIVDFSVNNYRQMLVDCGFASSYLASVAEAMDNCNLCYENGVYYIFTATSPSSALPLMCLKSTDLETWEVVGVVLSNNMRINEVSAVVKNGVGYIMYRTGTQGSFANFAIYNIANNVLINSGVFNDAVESRPDVFTFEGDVYLAYNVLPSTYNSATSSVRPDQGGRNEINVYKVVDNNPVFFRRICNPTGLNYFRFQETPVYVDSMNTWWNQGAIYMAYSEDRRHLYRRQFANISIADVTAVFADNGRIG